MGVSYEQGAPVDEVFHEGADGSDFAFRGFPLAVQLYLFSKVAFTLSRKGQAGR